MRVIVYGIILGWLLLLVIEYWVNNDRAKNSSARIGFVALIVFDSWKIKLVSSVEFLKTQFGLWNAPEAFHLFINDVPFN